MDKVFNASVRWQRDKPQKINKYSYRIELEKNIRGRRCGVEYQPRELYRDCRSRSVADVLPVGEAQDVNRSPACHRSSRIPPR